MIDRRAALLRGINVGKAKRVAMADLRALVEGLGYGDVKTLLNSGNVVFTVPANAKAKGDPAARIEEAMTAKLGVSSRVVVLTAEEMSAAVAGNPLLDVAHDPARLLVAVFQRPQDLTPLAPLAQQDWTPDALALGERVAYLWCAEGILASQLLAAASRAFRDTATTRNWTTMTKLAALLGAS